jgi:hypothetical protein
VDTNEAGITKIIITLKLIHSYPRPLKFVNILGFHKCPLLLDVPKTWFNNWPVDDSTIRNMSPRI